MAQSAARPPTLASKEAGTTNGSVSITGGGIRSNASSPVSYTTQRSSFSFRKSGANGSSNALAGDSSITSLLQSTASSLEKRSIAELGSGAVESISTTSFVNLVEFIGTERLSSLPHRGSKWDKVLMRALYFAEQQHGFEKMVKSFGTEDISAVSLGYGYARLLLKLGHENASALDKAFGILYKHSLEVSALLYRTELVSTTPQIREQLCLMYGDLLNLTSAVATRYYKAVYGMASTKVSLDIYDICGSVLESFRERQAQVAELIWARQAQLEGFDLDHNVSPKALKRWLTPTDRILSTLSSDHMALLGSQAEFTCLWFQKSLTAFAQGPSKVMAVTGPEGSGKTVLAASIAERLQRRLGRQTFSGLFYTIRGSMPAAATPISVLKSLLAQIFALRIGNMQTYHAIAHAYERCQFSTSEKDFEGHLWSALEEALKKPLDNARDLIIVVDGIDELHGGKQVAQAFFERLADAVADGKRAKVIGLGQSLSLPPGMNSTHTELTPDNIHDDLQSVILRNVMHTHAFTAKQGPEQEQVLERLVRASRGSFIWATLVSQMLKDIKTGDEFNKAVDNFDSTKPSVQDLVQRTLARHDIPATTKTILGWIIAAERPLTTHDIRTLLSAAPQNAPSPDQHIDIHSTLHTLETVLLFNEEIVRFKHPSIQRTVTTLVDTGKIQIPESRHADLLIRLLYYVRTTLREEPDPSFDEYDVESLERHFRESPLLLYVISYWVIHLQHLRQKVPQDLSKVLPTTTLLPQMERTFWTLELPVSQAIELYKTAYQIRQRTLPELSAATLQSTLNTAIVYEILGRPTEAATLYFTCTKIARNLLSNYHPLPIECGHRYLSCTETSITTSRTEVMTYREEVLKILITLFERQYGKQSTEVIRVRTQLAQLYEHVNEKQRAMEVWQTVRSDTVHVYGKDSSQARTISDQYNVMLSHAKPNQKVEVRNDSIFDEDEEEHIQEDLDIATVSRQISAAKDERTFVELWQRISSICRNTTASEWHERNIDVSMAYAKYLRANKRTEESSAIASSVAREYESNQASYSESVVSRLSETASFMREIGQYTAALAILKRTSQFFQSTRREESSQYIETQRQIQSVMSEAVSKDSSASQSVMLEDIYRQTIQDHSKTVDAKLLGIGKTLITQYIDEAKPTTAIELIRLTLQRTWPAFVTRTTTDVSLPSTFTKESLDFVEQLIECYTIQRQFDLVESTLLKLFNALLTPKSIDFPALRKIQARLIKYYDDNNYPEKSVTVLQKILPALRTHLGPTNGETVKTLYELGSRSRSRARTYPFWIEYYQQIVNVLNKDATVCHPDAMDALITVVTSYWEDRRYSEAVTMFTVLWTTFLQKPKDFKQFSQPEFVEQLYSRYYSCLEQTGARFEQLYQMSSEYRKTCITIFGAESAITAKATLSLARIAQSSDEHSSEAMGWYEEASKSGAANAQSKSEIKNALQSLYTRQIITTSSSSSTSMRSETIQSAISSMSESYSGYVAKYGYASEASLSQLKQLAILYKKQNKSETASRELTTASREIITKETSSSRMIEAAETIVSAFVASSTVAHAEKLVTELHRQIISKDSTSSSSWGFDLTKYGRSVLPFLASMEFHLHPTKYTSFSQLMAELTMEMWYYEDYRKLVQSNANLQSIIVAASTLRRFLVNSKRFDTVEQLDNEVGHIFVTRDGSRLKLKSQASGKIFMVAIMKYLGTYKTSSFVKAVILASNDSLEELMKTEKYAEAYDIAGCAFAFAVDYEGYSGAKGISHGFNLASLLAGIDFQKKCPDANLRTQMLHLSKEIVRKVLEICKKQDVDFAQVQLREINRLVVLLGELQDYETLEWLLTLLWHSRSAQSTWSQNTLHNLGRLLICARYLGGHPIQALRLCEDVAYNLRRTRGASHPATTDMNLLLAQLYTSSGHYYLAQGGGKDKNAQELATTYFAKALNVHEEMLRLLVNDATDGGIPGIDDDEDLDTTGAILAEHGIVLETAGSRITEDATARLKEEGSMARTHAKLLKLAYQRLGAWPKDKASGEYEKLVASAISTFSDQMKDFQGVDKWQTKGFGGGKAESGEGAFEKVPNWNLVEV